MAIEIRQHAPGKDLAPFLRVPFVVFRDDPNWIAPLEMEMRTRLTPGKNPFFEHAEAALFTAWRDGQPVGRISAQVDREHLRVHADDVGFFGFFDTVDDEEVGRALVDAACDWLRQRGMKRARGPLSLSINEEVGLLVEGFEWPPMVMMSHSRAYQGRIAEAAGLSKAKDLFAWRYVVGELPRRAERAWETITALPEVRIRTLSRKDLDRELDLVLRIQDDAWSENWGHVSLTRAEATQVASDFKLIIDEELALVAEIDGEPAAMCIAFPNLNEAIAGLDGKLFPVGFAKLLWRMKVRGTKTARLFMLGVRKKFRAQKRYMPLALALIVDVQRRGASRGIEWGELSWTLEDNAPVNVIIRALGGHLYKRYRVYEKELGA